MLSKEELLIMTKCESYVYCICDIEDKSMDCTGLAATTALELLERAETAEQIFKDILSSRSIKACEGEILKWLENK